jgi:hypothetical protein
MRIEKLVVDSTESVTDLCRLGVKHPTDKSPYNESDSLHKHPYTAVYNLLFSYMRYNPIVLGEIGILDNMSMLCWREYFPNATLYGYEYSEMRLQKALSDKLSNTVYSKMDVKDVESIQEGLQSTMFDIIIEDSTHEFNDQIRFANIAYKHIKPGGFLIIEDIFRSESEQRYVDALAGISKYFSSMTFVVTEHKNKYSPGWDNDKLLVLNRNNV